MDEEKLDLILEKIEELEEKIEDNNKILHSERNAKRWEKLFTLIKWIIITAIGIVAWAYIQPMYQSVISTYNSLVETTNKANAKLEALPKIEDFSLENLKKKISN